MEREGDGTGGSGSGCAVRGCIWSLIHPHPRTRRGPNPSPPAPTIARKHDCPGEGSGRGGQPRPPPRGDGPSALLATPPSSLPPGSSSLPRTGGGGGGRRGPDSLFLFLFPFPPSPPGGENKKNETKHNTRPRSGAAFRRREGRGRKEGGFLGRASPPLPPPSVDPPHARKHGQGGEPKKRGNRERGEGARNKKKTEANRAAGGGWGERGWGILLGGRGGQGRPGDDGIGRHGRWAL